MNDARAVTQELTNALVRRALNGPRHNLDEDLHYISLDYAIGGLSVKTLFALLTTFNDTLLVNKLPPELMFKIFLAMRGDYEPSPGRSNHWITSTLVCRRWRDIASKCKELWTTLIFDGMPLSSASVFLKNSAPHPLKVYIRWQKLSHWEPVILCDLIELLKAHTYRLAVFDLDATSNEFWTHIQSLQDPASLLERISLRNKDTAQTRLGPLFARQTPLLRHVLLQGMMYWSQGQFSGLTSLICFDQDVDDPEFVACLRDALLSCPHLHTLSLSGDGKSRSRRIPNSKKYPNVHLRHLRKLAFSSLSDSAIINVLRCMKMTETTNLVMGGLNLGHLPFFTFIPVPLPNTIDVSHFTHMLGQTTIVLQDASQFVPPRMGCGHSSVSTDLLIETCPNARSLRFYTHEPFGDGPDSSFLQSLIALSPQLNTIHLLNLDPASLLSPLLSADQKESLLEIIDKELRKETEVFQCTHEKHRASWHIHTLRVTSISFGGVPGRARVICGCRPSRSSNQNDMYILTVAVRGDDIPSFDEVELSSWLKSWKDILPDRMADDIDDMLFYGGTA
ncbi:unnamed protein product [Somion occarium]|uniref:F-box domain-containing protein n=1 Tax=Somion occarium TaxID=3059160 RepID=A0ABP1CU19_9APHY